MTRGNQRELARQKNLKKQQEAVKKKTSDQKNANRGLSLEERRQRDADVMRMKQKQAETKKEGSPSGEN